MTEGFWDDIALRIDARTRRSDRGRTLLGGSPLRLLRLTDAGAGVVDDLEAGAPVGPDPTRRSLARRLLDAGMAHPVVSQPPQASISVVVPVRDHTAELADLLDALDGDERVAQGGGRASVIVVDDGSADPAALAEVVAGRATIIRRPLAGGPAAARNAGWQATDTDLVAFVDADVVPPPGWLDELQRHFADPHVAAAAPRIRADAGTSALDRFETHRSPLDLGPGPSRVSPRSRVPYVPTAAVVYRRSVLEAMGGFDEGLRNGEDVDLVWRVVAAGHTVRYEPAVEVTHRNRPSWRGLVAQRYRYGTAAPALDQRQPGSVPPVEADRWTLLAWSLPVVAGPYGVAAGALVAAATTARLSSVLAGRVDAPRTEAVRLAGLGHLWAGRWIGRAVGRAWLPAAVAGSVFSRRLRVATVAALLGPAVIEWFEERPDLDPVRWVAACVVDDAAYCAGVWRGCWAVRSGQALLPRAAGIPGL